MQSSASGPRPTVCALLAVHNRRELTLRAVSAVLDDPAIDASAVVVDDGSTDGTAEAVTTRFARVGVRVVTTDGNRYWAAAMSTAERVARLADPDYLLWLNDDVNLETGAIRRLIAASIEAGGAVAVGATRDPSTNATTYSGLCRSRAHPLSYRLVEPGRSSRFVEAFNGNVVLVPREAATRVGGIDGDFAHAYADIDYGLRLRRAGLSAVLAPGFAGTCVRNSPAGTWRDRDLPVGRRIARLHEPKGAPPRSSARFLARHGGVAWPLFLLTPYARIVSEATVDSVRRLRISR
jgi:GT2 family glycosyltransferase